MNSILLALMMLCFFGITYGQNDDFFKKYQWKNRVILLYSPSTGQEMLRKQQEILDEDEAALKDRDLVVLHITPESGNSFQQIQSRYNLKDSFTFVLLGKDGGVKKQSEELVSLEALFSLIDSMPMRQAEMRRKDQ